jgi:hypothetical protein
MRSQAIGWIPDPASRFVLSRSPQAASLSPTRDWISAATSGPNQIGSRAGSIPLPTEAR